MLFKLNRVLLAGAVVCFFIQILFSQSIVAPDKAIDGFQAIRSDLLQKVADKKVPSISVGVVQNGKTLWKESFGYADVERKLAATPDTVYALGSLSKSITGTAVFKLVQDSKIDLNKPIDTYLRTQTINYHGRNPNDYKVFHLLNMAAGIPHFLRYCYVDVGDLRKCGNELLGQASFSAFRPGEVHLYSNLSFGLAAQMVADVSGKPFAEYMLTNIFKPAGMKSTFTHRSEFPTDGTSIARFYTADGRFADAFQFEPAGGGGFYSTVNDLLKYGSIHLKQPISKTSILNNQTLGENHRVRPELPHAYYANGWGVLPLPNNGTTLLSNGAIEGAASTLLVLPDSDMVIVVLVNKSVGNDLTDEIAFNLAGAVLPGYKKDLDTLFEKVGPLFADAEFKGDAALNGNWKGETIIDGRSIPLKLQIKDSQMSIELGKAGEQTVEGITTSTGVISGKFKSAIPSKLVTASPQDLTLQFRRSGNALTGSIQIELMKPKPSLLLAHYFTLEKISDE